MMNHANITIESLTKRKSTRSYENYVLTDEESKSISELMKSAAIISIPLDWKLSLDSPAGSGSIYSELKEKNPDSLVEYGFQGQQLLMRLEALDFGTCWLARSPLKSVPAIIAFGKKKSESVKGKFVKFFAGSDKRKELIELLKGNPHKLSLDTASIIEAARWAPSALNKQPWNFEVSDGDDRLIIRSGSPLDLGIVLANAFMGASSLFEKVSVTKLSENSYAIDYSLRKDG